MSGRATGLWTAWVELLDQREVGTSLALFRIAVGACVLASLGSTAAAGLVDVLWLTPADGGYLPTGHEQRLLSWLGGATTANVWALLWTGLGLGGLLVVGLGGRLTAFAALQVFLTLANANPHAGGSYDELLGNALWLCVLAPCTATLSLDARLRTGAFASDARVPAWGRFLAIYQLILCYWTTGLQKVSAYWTPGGDFSALYYILQQPSWQRSDMSWVASVYPLTQLATAVSWFWEVLAPLWLLAHFFRYTAGRPGRLRAWFNRVDVRLWFAAVGVGFHLLVHATMNVGPFSFVTLAFYACVVSPDEWDRVARWMRERVGDSARA